MIRRYAGATILELMLVIAIGASILYLSILQYQSYRYNADAAQVQANVNAIFQSLSAYYRQNCDRNPSTYIGPSGNKVAHTDYGTLNPLNSSFATFLNIDIQTDLRDNGFLTTNFPLNNPLVNKSGAGSNGYVAQFNLGTPTQRQICDTGPAACATPMDIGAITTWIAQVAVQIYNPTNNPKVAQTYLNLLGGDCLSTASGNQVSPCVANSIGSGNYVVWARLPSNSNIAAQSDYWTTMPTVSQFKQMYTTYPILNLTNGSATSNQNYLCGN
jgi:type II secretory pathway pseudopilin PulG